MEPARSGLQEAIATAGPANPSFPVYANVDASAVTDGTRAADLLLRQLTSPVRWTEVIQALARDFPDATFVEMGPGSVLAGLVKKIAPGRNVLTCGTAAEVDQLTGVLAQ
jgi:[acyl-carrier-protein] S-malonyltransferase